MLCSFADGMSRNHLTASVSSDVQTVDLSLTAVLSVFCLITRSLLSVLCPREKFVGVLRAIFSIAKMLCFLPVNTDALLNDLGVKFVP